MKEKERLIHTARINNNCPECYSNNGLEFTFSQVEVENKLYSKVKKDIIEKLYCHNCKQQVFPVNWDEDIERVYNYHSKMATPNNAGIKLKPLAYAIIIIDALTIGALIYYFNNS